MKGIVSFWQAGRAVRQEGMQNSELINALFSSGSVSSRFSIQGFSKDGYTDGISNTVARILSVACVNSANETIRAGPSKNWHI